jgi:hypothetical protein
MVIQGKGDVPLSQYLGTMVGHAKADCIDPWEDSA